MDRNIDALVQELAARCSRIFSVASLAAARSAQISSVADFASVQEDPHPPRDLMPIRERTSFNEEVEVTYISAEHTMNESLGRTPHTRSICVLISQVRVRAAVRFPYVLVQDPS